MGEICMLKYERDMEKKKFKEMDFKEKVQHIVEYYKYHILAGIITVIVIFSFLNMWVFNPRAVPSSSIVLSSQYVDGDGQSQLMTEIQTDLPELMTDNREVTVMSIPMSDNSMDPTAMAMVQKMAALVAASDIDLIIGDEKTMRTYAARGYFTEFKEVLDTETYESLKNDLIKSDVILESDYDEEGNMVIKEKEEREVLLKHNSSQLKQALPLEQDIYIGFMVNSKRIEDSVTVLKYLINE